MSTKPTTTDLEWTELDQRAVDTARVLAADAVQKVGNGHPGTAMSLAPAAYTLFQKVMRHDPADADWVGRDRFVLSAGHSSLTLYTQLYLAGFGLIPGVNVPEAADFPKPWPRHLHCRNHAKSENLIKSDG